MNGYEKLDEQWINKHSWAMSKFGVKTYAVPVVDLQNLLVPKQELPVIPNYVAKWISEHHEKLDLYPALRRLENGSTRDYVAYKWYRKNTRKFVNAYLTGKYEVEEEQKYYVSARVEDYGGFWFLSKNNNGDVSIGTNKDYFEAGWESLKLTEQEIKDYDERYFAFAKPVEELEE